MKERIRVAYICHFTNDFCTKKLEINRPLYSKIYNWFKGNKSNVVISESAIWNTNAIKEFQKFEDRIEVHVISPYPFLRRSYQEFSENNICYHFFRDKDDVDLFFRLFRKVIPFKNYPYYSNSRRIRKFVNKIAPDVIHLIGAENPSYGCSIFSLPKQIPILVQLQTLLCDPDFKDNYYMSQAEYQYRSSVEHQILERADYIGTAATKFIPIIQSVVGEGVKLIDTTLALSEPIATPSTNTTFDFVYFASNIRKACDIAVKAFILAAKIKPDITLDIVGDFDIEFKNQLDEMLTEAGFAHNVYYEGKLPTHDDVICQIRKSKFALLPLRIDLTSGTIREAQANGIPVITTDTGELGTQRLNRNRETVLISSKDDIDQLSTNMIRLLDDNGLADNLRKNSYQEFSSRQSNEKIVSKYIEKYAEIIAEKTKI